MNDQVQLHHALSHARRLDIAHRTSEAIAQLENTLKTTEHQNTALALEAAFFLIELRNTFGTSVSEIRDELKRWGVENTQRGQIELGWAAYRESGYLSPSDLEALVFESEALPHTTQLRALLLVGKVLTEQNALHAARLWLLRGMQCSREQLNDEYIAAFSGALAEVFYLGGELKTALELFELDARLLPPGSRDVERLLVYRGHCYRQLGEIQVAQTLYQEAYMRSKLRDVTSAYALRGLLWCAVLRGDAEKSHHWLQELRSSHDKHSLALGLIAAATLSSPHRQEYIDEAAQYLKNAHYAKEWAWLTHQTFELRNANFERLQEKLQPHTLDACDRPLLDVELRAITDTFHHTQSAFQANEPHVWMGAFF